MTNILFNRKHWSEYAVYGSAAGVLYALSVWYLLFRLNHYTPSVLFSGAVLFTAIIMMYAIRLTRRKAENYSTWGMIIAGQMAIAVGIVVSVMASFALCCVYMPGYFTSNEYAGTLELIFSMATIANYCSGAFISAMVAYAFKPDQTGDETPEIFEESIKSGIEQVASEIGPRKIIKR